jgi:hypothetical protein
MLLITPNKLNFQRGSVHSWSLTCTPNTATAPRDARAHGTACKQPCRRIKRPSPLGSYEWRRKFRPTSSEHQPLHLKSTRHLHRSSAPLDPRIRTGEECKLCYSDACTESGCRYHNVPPIIAHRPKEITPYRSFGLPAMLCPAIPLPRPTGARSSWMSSAKA